MLQMYSSKFLFFYHYCVFGNPMFWKMQGFLKYIYQICNVLATSKDIQELKFISLPLIDGNI